MSIPPPRKGFYLTPPHPLEIAVKLHTFLEILGSSRTPHTPENSNPFWSVGGVWIFSATAHCVFLKSAYIHLSVFCKNIDTEFNLSLIILIRFWLIVAQIKANNSSPWLFWKTKFTVFSLNHELCNLIESTPTWNLSLIKHKREDIKTTPESLTIAFFSPASSKMNQKELPTSGIHWASNKLCQNYG